MVPDLLFQHNEKFAKKSVEKETKDAKNKFKKTTIIFVFFYKRFEDDFFRERQELTAIYELAAKSASRKNRHEGIFWVGRKWSRRKMMGDHNCHSGEWARTKY